MVTRRSNKFPLYFFYEGDLHKKLHINRGADLLVAWNYPKGKSERYSYTAVRKYGEKAFSTPQVSTMVNRQRKVIWRAIKEGNIKEPQFSYGLDENRNKYKHFWSEKDIMDLHDFLTTVHRGRPRKDGLITTSNLPTAAELRAMVRQGTVFYVKGEDGEFIPTWDAEKF